MTTPTTQQPVPAPTQQPFTEFLAPMKAKLAQLQTELKPKLDEFKSLNKAIAQLSGEKNVRAKKETKS